MSVDQTKKGNTTKKHLSSTTKITSRSNYDMEYK